VTGTEWPWQAIGIIGDENPSWDGREETKRVRVVPDVLIPPPMLALLWDDDYREYWTDG